jgi:hypothetical protein
MNMGIKVCMKCNVEKPLDEFYFRKDTNRFNSRCNECIKNYHQEYYDKHKEKIKNRASLYYNENLEKVLEQTKIYRDNNVEKIKQRKVDYHIKNCEKIRKKVKNWRENNKNKRVQSEKERRNNDKLYAMRINSRNRIKVYLKKCGLVKKNPTFEIIGCTPEFLKEYLERQFQDNMRWDNYGYYGWHIDHIIPLSSAKTEEEIYKLCHYTNLQPLWAEENIKKSNKLLKTI